MSGLFGTKQKSAQTQTNNAPWAGVQPHLLNLFNRGASALNAANPLSMSAGNALGTYLSPGFLNPETNPAFRSSVNDALGLAKSQFAGQYGGAAGSNLSNSGYQESLARGLGAAATNAYADQFNKNQAAQLSAISAAPQADFAASPFANLERFKSLLGAGQGYGSSTSQQPYYENRTANTLGLASLAAPFFLGFSDVRLKENIERIGTHDTGIGLYKYNFKGDPKPQIGVLAQELEKVKPEAVHDVGGVKMVDFRMI
jgi:hypothetical protein